MNPLRRRSDSATDQPADEGAVAVDDSGVLGSGKGRPTPKRRDSQPNRGPVRAPKTRKEAAQRQKQQAKQPARAGAAAPAKLSQAEYRAALKRGDPSVLPRKEQGPVRALARNYVDSRRMLANYLLLLFPLLIVSSVVRILDLVVLAVVVVIAGEGYLTGRKIHALAVNRGLEKVGGVGSLAFYAVTRAYMPRKWRMPAPRVQIGEEI